MRNRIITFLLFSFSPFFLFAGGTAAQNPNDGVTEKIEAYFFYEELCATCHDDEVMFQSILKEKLPLEERNQYPNNFQFINIFSTQGRGEYLRITDELGLDRDLLQVPLLVLDGKVFQGYDSIGANIREAYFTAAEDLYIHGKPYNPEGR